MRWQDWPEPAAAPGQAVVAVRAVGICGSDIHGYSGESGRRALNMIMGHEATGEILAVGPGISPDIVGDPVVIQPFINCGTCDYCTAGKINLCRKRQFLGGNVDGAMAEYLAVPVENLVPLPKGLSFEHGTLVEPLAVAIHAVSQAGDITGKSLLIVGCGPIGLLTLVAAKKAGAQYIAVTDLLTSRLETALRLGADVALPPASEAWNENLEVDVAFDAVGIAATFNQAIQAVRPGGTVVALGGWQTVPMNLAPFVARELTLRATFNFTPAEFELARRRLEDRAFDPSVIVTNTYPLSEGAGAFQDLSTRQTDAVKVVLNNTT